MGLDVIFSFYNISVFFLQFVFLLPIRFLVKIFIKGCAQPSGLFLYGCVLYKLLLQLAKSRNLCNRIGYKSPCEPFILTLTGLHCVNLKIKNCFFLYMLHSAHILCCSLFKTIIFRSCSFNTSAFICMVGLCFLS